MQTRWVVPVAAMLVLWVALVSGACAKKRPPVARPMPPASEPAPPSIPTPSPAPTSTSPKAVTEPELAQPEPAVKEDVMAARSLDELNRESPLKPAFFEYDSAELDAPARTTLTANAEELKKHPTWTVTIEGHCDERGTAEYNLALGERRAIVAQTYLVSLGISADKLRTVSYGKEFPFDPGHNEGAWGKNRRAHFVITAK
jgi:peptidoglycan-associated lipoprotein